MCRDDTVEPGAMVYTGCRDDIVEPGAMVYSVCRDDTVENQEQGFTPGVEMIQ